MLTFVFVFSEYGISDYDKQIIVNKHNELRKLIANGQVQGQPRGVNLKRIVGPFLSFRMYVLLKCKEFELNQMIYRVLYIGWLRFILD